MMSDYATREEILELRKINSEVKALVRSYREGCMSVPQVVECVQAQYPDVTAGEIEYVCQFV